MNQDAGGVQWPRVQEAWKKVHRYLHLLSLFFLFAVFCHTFVTFLGVQALLLIVVTFEKSPLCRTLLLFCLFFCLPFTRLCSCSKPFLLVTNIFAFSFALLYICVPYKDKTMMIY